MTSRYGENVFSVHEDAMAIDAFRLMVEKEVSAVAIVNTDGKLTGTLSLRDLKAMSVDGRLFWRLYQTVKNYLVKVQRETAPGARPRHLITCSPTETIEATINKLTEFHIHRVFIVDAAHKPVGVISLKDILLEIISD